MSTKEALIPIHVYPGGAEITPPTENVTYSWIEPLGGGSLSEPIAYGTIRPDGKLAHHGIATISG